MGNARISFARNSAGALEITDANDYYPFGMNHLRTGNSFFGKGVYQNYKYNGKELQETGIYDYGARFYMPQCCRANPSRGIFIIDSTKNKYIYNYTDHLGNVRLSYMNTGSGSRDH